MMTAEANNLSSKSRLGFHQVMKSSPGLADYKTRTALRPRYRFGWLMSDDDLRAITPPELHWRESPTMNYVHDLMNDCCAVYGESFDISVVPLGPRGTDLLGRNLLYFTFLHFTNNRTPDALAKAEDEEIIKSLTRVLKAENNPPVWLLDDYRV
ncbi:hypothetical protein MIND_00744500 [Mycena indigotica]|uniref:Uncharacterized protein n=1 Tax=Mycena indigotica TaxID=2126181 RepID=A0A8H6W4T1_9AGAR|nr:uncharacterized protein MIND_00744500 [Mycena indigotica]KAF7301788.1 hypothetical protein MIND_00744500 [Mycena indigotica]